MNTMATTLHDSAMLVTLAISQWTARKHDKSVSSEVERAHQAKDAGRYNKLLVAKESLEGISKIASAARSFHYKMTLPWGDNGDRLLPAILFEQYANSIRQYKSEFEQRVSQFVRDYPQLKSDARTRLGTMYQPQDYPDVGEIRSRFDIQTEFTPVPTSGDFRVNLSEEYVTSIRSDIEQRMELRQRKAVSDCWDRVRDVVKHIHERLADKDNKFRDTLISNAEELIALLPALNITGDPELTKIGEDVKAMLVHPDRLRTDETLRDETARKAADILARFSTKPLV